MTSSETPGLSALAVMENHVSCRRYRPEPLAPELLEQIVRAAQRAPSSSNLQAYSIITVTDPERKARLAELAGRQQHIAACGAFLLFCPDLYRLQQVCKRQGRTFGAHGLEMYTVAVVEAALAAQNGATAAESMGLGTCMIGAVRNEPQAIRELLALPEGVFALMGLCVGYPAGQPKPPRGRLPLAVVCHQERYDPMVLMQGVAEYDADLAAVGFYAGRELPGPPVSTYGWAEHTARRVSSLRQERRDLRRHLEDAGYSFL